MKQYYRIATNIKKGSKRKQTYAMLRKRMDECDIVIYGKKHVRSSSVSDTELPKAWDGCLVILKKPFPLHLSLD